MNNEFWFPWYPGAFAQKTLHLTAEEDGIYRRLIDHYMVTAQPLPDNLNAIARISGVACDSHALRIPLAFFTHKPGIGYRHKTCDSILADIYEKHVKRKGAAKAAANSRWKNIYKIQDEKCATHTEGNADAMRPDATPTLRPREREESKKVSILVGDAEKAAPPKSKKPYRIHFDYETGQFSGDLDGMSKVWAEAYPAIDIASEISKAKGWMLSNRENRKSNIPRFLASWLARAQDRASNRNLPSDKRFASVPMSFAERDQIANDAVIDKLRKELSQ